MQLLLALVAFVAILILPIKLAASFMDAGKTSYLSCFIAIILVAAIYQGLSIFLPVLSETNIFLQFIVSLFISAFVYMFVLETTYKKGIAIAGIQLVLMAIFIVVAGLLIPGAELNVNIGGVE